VLERIIYNGLISGVSLSGDRFFYQNPLESAGKYERSAWFEVACCPANVARFLPTLPGYIYATSADSLYINLFASGSARAELPGRSVELIQETKYPWEGAVKILVNSRPRGTFTIRLRIPGWAQTGPVPSDLYRFLDRSEQPVRLWVNRKPVALKVEKGYALLRRKWGTNNLIEVILPMPNRRVVAHDLVKADAGRVAIQRGPIVFCAEGVDNGGRALNIVLPDDAKLEHWFRPDLLGGVAIVTAKAIAVGVSSDGKILGQKAHPFLAVPYFAWGNRGPNEMRVWLPRTPDSL
jgi:DUF1680 family protein